MKKINVTLIFTIIVYALSNSFVFAYSVSGSVEAPDRVKKIIVFVKPVFQKGLKSKRQSKIVSQKDTLFKPLITVIGQGDRIFWLNDETKDIDHNIFSLSSLNRFDLGLGAKDTKIGHTFNNTGVQNYYCSVHKSMEGKVVVLPTRYYQHLESPSNFSIDQLPKGEWELDAIVFHRRYKAIPVRFKVKDGAVNKLLLKIEKR